MATNQELSIEIIAQIAMMVGNAAVEAILEGRRDEDVINRCRGDTRGMRPRENGHSPVYTYANKVKNSLHTQKIYKAMNISVAKDIRDKQTIIQEEHEENNQTVKSLQFCKMKRCKGENVEEWIRWVRRAAKEC